MTGDQIAQFGYLSLILLAVGGWLFAQLRRNPGRTAQAAVVWALLFLGVMGAAGLWTEMRGQIAPMQEVTAPGRIELPRQRDGHYHLTAMVNGVPVDFIVDTGATEIVLSQVDAARIGFAEDELRFFGSAQTANGTVQTAPVVLQEFVLGEMRDTGLRAVVNGGPMEGSLLGMTYLSRFDRIEIADGRMALIRD